MVAIHVTPPAKHEGPYRSHEQQLPNPQARSRSPVLIDHRPRHMRSSFQTPTPIACAHNEAAAATIARGQAPVYQPISNGSAVASVDVPAQTSRWVTLGTHCDVGLASTAGEWLAAGKVCPPTLMARSKVISVGQHWGNKRFVDGRFRPSSANAESFKQ